MAALVSFPENALAFPEPGTAIPQAPAASKAPESPIPNPEPQIPSANPCHPTFSPRQRAFLRLIAKGLPVFVAAQQLGVTRHAWDKWRVRNPDFRRAADAARNSHCLDIADGLEDAAAYARVLVDQCQRDESQPMHLRLRCSLAILNRNPKRWLPADLPEPMSQQDLDTLAGTLENSKLPERACPTEPATQDAQTPTERDQPSPVSSACLYDTDSQTPPRTPAEAAQPQGNQAVSQTAGTGIRTGIYASTDRPVRESAPNRAFDGRHVDSAPVY